MKRKIIYTILIIALIFTFCLFLVGCAPTHEKFESGDFIYMKNPSNADEIIICGLSESGLKKEVIEFPNTLDDYTVSQLGYSGDPQLGANNANIFLFYSKNLKNIIIPSHIDIAEKAFVNCENLTFADLRAFDDIQWSDNFFSKRTTIISENGIGYSADNIVGDFVILKNTIVCYFGFGESIAIPNGINSIGSYAFWGRNSVKTLNSSSVGTCYIDNLELSVGEGSFGGTGTTSVLFKNGSVPINAFSNCGNLSTVVLNDINVISDNSFSSSSIKSLEISNVTDINISAFSGCENLSSISCSNSTNYSSYENGLYQNDSIFFYPQGIGGEIKLKPGTKIIGEKAFSNSGASSLIATDVEIVEEKAFLESKIENFSFGSLKKIKSAAFMNSKIKAIDLTGVEFVSNHAFSYSELAAITISESLVTLGVRAFFNTNLESVCFPSNSKITVLSSELFAECSKLKIVTLPANLLNIGKQTFAKCSSLEKIDIPDGVTVLPTKLFEKCEVLSEIKIPKNLVEISDHAFYECAKLASFIFPTSVTTIGDNAFENSGIKNVFIPKSISAIGNSAFKGCIKIKSISVEHKSMPEGFNVDWNRKSNRYTSGCSIFFSSKRDVERHKVKWNHAVSSDNFPNLF